MSTLRSAIEELQADDVGAADDQSLETDLAEVMRAADLLHGEALRRIAEVARRGMFRRDGHLSMTAWLAQRFRLAFSVASGHVRDARALRSMPATRRALANGEIGSAALTALAIARDAHPDHFHGAEPLLVEAATRLGVGDLRRAIVHWRDAIDRRQIENDDRARFERRNLHVSPAFEGMGRVDGDLDPETTETLVTALRAVMDAQVRTSQDRRTPPQRRVDALGEICRQWLGLGERPAVAGERPHVTVTVDLDTLQAHSGGVADLRHGGTVAGETARRIACDASIVRVITRGRSEPLDVGRRTASRPRFGARSLCATGAAHSRDAIDLSRGATRSTCGMGPRRRDGAIEPGVAMSAPSPVDPRRRLRCRDRSRQTDLHAPGWRSAGRSCAAVGPDPLGLRCRAMRAMVLETAGRPLVERELPDPETGPGQVRLSVLACGVCRTDLHVADGELPDPKLPLILGHQIVGTIDAVGEGVDAFRAGDRVGVPWLGWTCGVCDYCTTGRENLCRRARFTGYQIDGGYAERAVADARFCFPIPEGYPDTQAAPLLCAGLIGYRCLRMAGDAERLGIYGFGGAAHILTQVAIHQGRRVFAFTRPGDERTQAFARGLGAEWAGSSTEEPPEPLDAAILFAAAGELVPLALRAVAPGGTVVCGEIHMSDIPSFPYDLVWGERVLRSVANLTRADATEFLALAPRIPVRTAVTAFPLAEANEAMETLRSGSVDGAIALSVDER